VTADGALAAALTRTLLDAEHREALRRRGRARALDFTPARTASRVLDLIEAVVHGVAPVEAR
jgi:glycosyltransferase involved in cell wall biosynthesis